MSIGNTITQLLVEKKAPLFSVEFFPPKSKQGAKQILHTAEDLSAFGPDFVSITYGAGGSTREKTLEYGNILQNQFDFEVMPHLTCVGHSKDELRTILDDFHKTGFRNIMTLRGDPPKGQTTFQAHPQGLRYASELVTFIKAEFPDFCLGVAGYPEKHPEAASLETDLENLAHKVAQGSDFITTQLFFDNADYFNFVDRCRALGISVPIIPGILPAISLEQVKRFCNFCGAKLPPELEAELANVANDEAASEQVGIRWAQKQIEELLAKGAPGYHLYILNRSSVAIQLLQRLKQ